MTKISVKAIIIRNNKILLLKPRNPQGSIKGWDGPGGHVKKGESILEALKREVFEETRLNVEKAFPVKLLSFPHNDTSYLIFLCTTSNDKVVLSNEHLDFKWAKTDFLKKLAGNRLIKELLEAKNLIDKITGNNSQE